MARPHGGTVDIQGGLWGADLIAALTAGGEGLPSETVHPES